MIYFVFASKTHELLVVRSNSSLAGKAFARTRIQEPRLIGTCSQKFAELVSDTVALNPAHRVVYDLG